MSLVSTHYFNAYPPPPHTSNINIDAGDLVSQAPTENRHTNNAL